MKNLLAALSVAALLCGCAPFGPQAQAPGHFEESLFTVTNVPMVTTRTTTNVVTVTNVIPVLKEQVVEVNHTNEFGVVIPKFETNTVTVYETNRSPSTNVIAAGTTVLVPQLTGTTAAGSGIQSTVSGIAGMFGYGGIATILLSGLGHWYQASRNKALQASYTGATNAQTIANQAGGALTQNVETLLEVLKGTPQGQAAMPAIMGYLRTHQLEAGVADAVDSYIAANVDNPAAKESAAALLKLTAGLKAA